jgi:Domain of unknown function (DUF5667)
MPAGQGNDAERFATAVDLGTPPGSADDGELARDLQIVAMLRSRGAAFAPDADAKARAKQRLMEVLAAEQADRNPNRPPGAQLRAVPPPAAAERTVPMGRLAEPPSGGGDTDASAETLRMAPVTARQPAASADSAPTEVVSGEALRSDDTPTQAAHAGRVGRRARHSLPNRPSGRSRAAQRPKTPSLRRRVTVVGATALVAMIALAGGGVFASRDALPGDNLYAMKRAAESAELALALDDTEKARQHLEIAATRLSEVEQLTARNDPTGSAPAVAGALQEFESATGEGSRLLLTKAGPGGDRAAIDELRTWADEQATRLSELRPALPSAADAERPRQLLDRVLGRTEALSSASSCGREPSGEVDDLGPVPSCAPSARRAAAPDSEPATTTDPSRSTTDEESPSSRSGADRDGDDESDERTDTSQPTPDDDRRDGLLPDLRPETTPPTSSSREDEGSSDDDDSTKERGSDGGAGGGAGDAPVPLLPPITLPPLLPGLPGITIG